MTGTAEARTQLHQNAQTIGYRWSWLAPSNSPGRHLTPQARPSRLSSSVKAGHTPQTSPGLGMMSMVMALTPLSTAGRSRS